jgi:hypothetical protein
LAFRVWTGLVVVEGKNGPGSEETERHEGNGEADAGQGLGVHAGIFLIRGRLSKPAQKIL